ncbi:unnamed protein product [Strongylus vulgaris]|uniref:Uncharacterized protein n=1 Tax=Strongylus vulgaris TaxID=40348 RepID=A0A3P7K2Z6_STRVU|nr:unnamed protein product [Strongylus vulgaris]
MRVGVFCSAVYPGHTKYRADMEEYTDIANIENMQPQSEIRSLTSTKEGTECMEQLRMLQMKVMERLGEARVGKQLKIDIEHEMNGCAKNCEMVAQLSKGSLGKLEREPLVDWSDVCQELRGFQQRRAGRKPQVRRFLR